ncbi:hypothetical protein C3L33_05298, partial [Rhododendron williamsianum]
MKDPAELFDYMQDVVVVVCSRPSEMEEKSLKVLEEEEMDEDDDKDKDDEEEEGGGTRFVAGVVINKRWYILTCAHLVPKSYDVTVQQVRHDDSREAEVFLWGEDYDLAILGTNEASVGHHNFCKFGGTKGIHMGITFFRISHPHGIVYNFLVGNVAYPERTRQQIPYYYLSTVPDKGSEGFDFALRPKPLKKLVKLCNEKLKAEEEDGEHSTPQLALSVIGCSCLSVVAFVVLLQRRVCLVGFVGVYPSSLVCLASLGFFREHLMQRGNQNRSVSFLLLQKAFLIQEKFCFRNVAEMGYDARCYSKKCRGQQLYAYKKVNGLPCSPVKWVDAVQKMSCRVKADIVPNA